MAVYNVDENLTPVLLDSNAFVSFHLGTAGLGLEGAGLGLGLVTAGLDYNTATPRGVYPP